MIRDVLIGIVKVPKALANAPEVHSRVIGIKLQAEEVDEGGGTQYYIIRERILAALLLEVSRPANASAWKWEQNEGKIILEPDEAKVIAAPQSWKAPMLEVELAEVSTEPVFQIFQAMVRDQRSVSRECFGSRPELSAFIRGVRVGCAVFGFHPEVPEIPESPTTFFTKLADGGGDDDVPF